MDTPTLSIDPNASPVINGRAPILTNPDQVPNTRSSINKPTRKEAWGETEVKYVNPKSQSGTLHVYIQGFIKRRQDTRLKSGDTYSIDCISYPEEVNLSAEGNRLTNLPSSIDFDGYCTFAKQQSIPITWALQQRKISFLRFLLSIPDTSQKGLPSTSKRTVAKYDFDLVSVLGGENSLFYGFLPLFASSVEVPTKDFSNNIYGWLFVGFKFLDYSSAASNNPPDLSVKAASMWTNVINASSGMKWGLISNVIRNNENLRPSERFLIDNNSSAPSVTSLHIALGDFQITAMDSRSNGNTVNQAISAQDINGATYIVRINGVDQYSPFVEINGELFATRNIQWAQEDLILPVINNNDEFGTVLEITIFKLLDFPSSTVESNIQSRAASPQSSSMIPQYIGECKVTLPNSELKQGVPINYLLPIRDMVGIRAGTLGISIHASNILGNPSADALGNTNATGTSTLQTALPEKYSKYLKLEFLEGNLSTTSNPSNALENMVNNTNHLTGIGSIFFESKLSFQNNPTVFKDWISRSGYINLSARSNELTNNQNNGTGAQNACLWNCASRISLPEEVFTILERSNNLDSLSLFIECKDATRLKGSTVGRAVVSIPNGLFRNPNKGFEQWVTITRASSSSSSSSNPMMDRSPLGRVHLRLSLQKLLDSGFPSIESGQGIGIFSCLINGINTSKSPPGVYENSILAASLSNAIVLKNLQNGSSDEMKEDVNHRSFKIDQKVCYPLHYGNNSSLSMFLPAPSTSPDGNYVTAGYSHLLNPGILGVNTQVFTGHSELTFDVKTDSSLNAYNSSFPLMKTIAKISENDDFLDIPPLVLSLVKKSSASMNRLNENKMIASKADPKLSISGCFIPFIEGKLFIQVDNISPVGGTNPAALDNLYYLLRFSVGIDSPRFVFTEYLPQGNNQNNSTIRGSLRSKQAHGKKNHNKLKTSSKLSARSNNNQTKKVPSPPPLPLPSSNQQHHQDDGNTNSFQNIVSLNIHTRDLLLELDESLQPVIPNPSDKQSAETGPTVNTNALPKDRKNLQVLLPLILHASCGNYQEFSQNKDNFAVDEETDDNILVGICYTAPIYVDALRKISAEGKAPGEEDCDNGDHHHPQNAQKGKNQNESENLNWRRVHMELYEKRTRRLVSVVELRLAFKVEHVPHYVREPIQRLFYGNQVMSPEMARLELGLKQAFTLADTDKSHFVSSDELLKVIQNTNNNNNNQNTVVKKKTINGNKSNLTIGLDNPAKLLYTLARKASSSTFSSTQSSAFGGGKTATPGNTLMLDNNPEGDIPIDGETLVSMVTHLFRRLDVDGDGLISWWEWKSVLTALLCQSDEPLATASMNMEAISLTNLVTFIDPVDPLFICFFAVADLLPCQDNFHKFSEEINLVLDAIKPNLPTNLRRQNNYIESGSVITDNTFAYNSLASVSGGKYSKRLTGMIKSLRQSNTILTKRLEDAIIASQNNMISSPNSPHSPMGFMSPGGGGANNPENQMLKEQIDFLNHQSLKYYQQFNQEKLKNEELTLLLNQQTNNLTLSQQLLEQNNLQLTTLQNLLNSELNNFETNRLQKKLQKEKQFNALITIMKFMKKIVLPYFRKKLLFKQKLNLNQKIYSSYQKKKLRLLKEQKQKSILTIQKHYRGHHSRKQLKEMKKGIVKLQSNYRRKKAKGIYQKKKETSLLRQLIAKKLLAKVIKRLWLAYQDRKRKLKAKKQWIVYKTILSYIYRCRYLKKKQLKSLQEKLLLQQNTAASIIQQQNRKIFNKYKIKEKRKLLMKMKKFQNERTSLYFMKFKPFLTTEHYSKLWIIDAEHFQLNDERDGKALDSDEEEAEKEKKAAWKRWKKKEKERKRQNKSSSPSTPMSANGRSKNNGGDQGSPEEESGESDSEDEDDDDEEDEEEDDEEGEEEEEEELIVEGASNNKKRKQSFRKTTSNHPSSPKKSAASPKSVNSMTSKASKKSTNAMTPTSTGKKTPTTPKELIPKYKVGERIEGLYAGNRQWYSATITKQDIQTIPKRKIIYSLLYDDGDVEENMPEIRIRPRKPHPLDNNPIHQYKIGEIIESYFDDYEQWYRGKIKVVNPIRDTGKIVYVIEYDDGDIETNVLPERIRYFKKYSGNYEFKFHENDPVEARYKGGKDWFHGKILGCHKNEDYGPVYHVLYEDGDEEDDVKEWNLKKILTPEEIEAIKKEEEAKHAAALASFNSPAVTPVQGEGGVEGFQPIPSSQLGDQQLPPVAEESAGEGNEGKKLEVETANGTDQPAEGQTVPAAAGGLEIVIPPPSNGEVVETIATKPAEPQRNQSFLITKGDIPQLDEDHQFLRRTERAYLSELMYFGKVLSINKELRLMEVQYLVNLNTLEFSELFELLTKEDYNNEDDRNFPKFVTKMVSFDAPNNIWYSTIEPELSPRPPESESEEEPVEEEEEEEEELPFPDELLPPQPLEEEPEPEENEEDEFEEIPNDGYVPPLKDCIHYRYYYVSFSHEGEELTSNYGKIVRIDMEKNLIGVDFRPPPDEKEKDNIIPPPLTPEQDEKKLLSREEKERESKIKEDSKSPDSSSIHKLSSAHKKKSQKQIEKEELEAALQWIPYNHPYLCWFNKQKQLLTPRKGNNNNNASNNNNNKGGQNKSKKAGENSNSTKNKPANVPTTTTTAAAAGGYETDSVKESTKSPSVRFDGVDSVSRDGNDAIGLDALYG